ncbi:MAG: hypothetical protein JWL64_1301, partial [Frankiales bacterium]|nr:hypothetical protein [Frankiales bacterium]
GQVEVPSVVGLTIGDATQALKTAGGFTPTIVYQVSPGEPGRVLLQSLPATTKAPRGSAVTLTVSQAAPPPTTPPPTTPPPTTPAPTPTPTASPSVSASPALSVARPTR